jgi:hypothetical protein
MKLGLLSDSHDNIWALDDALQHLETADAVIHCGDLIAPFVLKRMAIALDVPIHIVWGNNDGDKKLLTEMAGQYKHVTIHGEIANLEISGRKIAVNHYPEIAHILASSGHYDMVCFGHDHTAHESRIGETLFLNPGEVMGLNGRRTIMMVDLETLDVEWIELP